MLVYTVVRHLDTVTYCAMGAVHIVHLQHREAQ